MICSWIYIHRKSAITRLVIPGWSILPRYFATLFPDDNLIVLNPFISNAQQLSTYYGQELASEDTDIKNKSIEDILSNINRIFIFSMGLQWVSEHGPQLLNMPCDIVSPAVSYSSSELNPMIHHLKTGKQAVLRSFYRRCFHSNDDWSIWKQQELQSHLTYNNADKLIEWLDYYGRIHVDIPNTQHITVWLDQADPIGEKPVVDYAGVKLTVRLHNYGHLKFKA